MNKVDHIVGFKTGLLDAHLTSAKKYCIYERCRTIVGDEYTGDLICSVNKTGEITWHKYPQGDFVGLKIFELNRLIDICISELNYLIN